MERDKVNFKKLQTILQWQINALLLTANSRHFLRVNAQMHNLDKQKTAQIRQTLWAMLKTSTLDNDILEIL